MKKVLIVHYSVSGKAETMATFVAEGVRFSGAAAETKSLSDTKEMPDLAAYDGLILGSPTFSLDLPQPVKNFLTRLKGVKVAGKMGGAFGSYKHDESYRHDTFAPAIILGIMENQLKMVPFELGPLTLQEDAVETRDSLRACQTYGRVFGEKLGA